jgi:hypothetical protein
MTTRTNSCALCLALLLGVACGPGSVEDDGSSGAGGAGQGGEPGAAGGGDGGSSSEGGAAGQGGDGSAGEAGSGGAGGSASPCGADVDNLDGSCTRVIEASVGQALSAYMQREGDACPLNAPASAPSAPATTWTVEAYITGGERVRRSSFLTFDTASLAVVSSVDSAEMRVHHADSVGHDDGVLLIGGAQPLFGDALDSDDFGAGVLPPVDAETMADIEAQGFASFTVPAAQINTAGSSQFILHLARLCDDFDAPKGGNNYWEHYAPGNADPARRPSLVVVYHP